MQGLGHLRDMVSPSIGVPIDTGVHSWRTYCRTLGRPFCVSAAENADDSCTADPGYNTIDCDTNFNGEAASGEELIPSVRSIDGICHCGKLDIGCDMTIWLGLWLGLSLGVIICVIAGCRKYRGKSGGKKAASHVRIVMSAGLLWGRRCCSGVLFWEPSQGQNDGIIQLCTT